MARNQGTTRDGKTGEPKPGADRPGQTDFQKLEGALDGLLQALSEWELDTGFCQPAPVVKAMNDAEAALTETTGISIEERVNARFDGGQP